MVSALSCDGGGGGGGGLEAGLPIAATLLIILPAANTTQQRSQGRAHLFVYHEDAGQVVERLVTRPNLPSATQASKQNE